jgi:hypothetical protein
MVLFFKRVIDVTVRDFDGLLRALKIVFVTRAVILLQGRTVGEGVRERVLGRYLGYKREKITGRWKKFGSDHIYDVSSLNICRGMKSSGMRWAKFIARLRKKMNEYRTLVRKPEGHSPFRGTELRYQSFENCN